MPRSKKPKDAPAHLPPPEKAPEPVELSFPEAVRQKNKPTSIWLWVLLAIILLAAMYYVLTQQL
jgi:hypothetical protein